MGKKNSKKLIEQILDGTISATECTGLLQEISVDNDEIEEFHREYNK